MLMGAPLFVWIESTILIALFMTILLLDIGIHFLLGINLTKEQKIQVGSTVFFAWLGAFMLPLDWQKDYQVKFNLFF
jgi:hypothetical protein